MNNYESLVVPGLLQPEDYARAVITGVLPMASEHEVEQRVQAVSSATPAQQTRDFG